MYLTEDRDSNSRSVLIPKGCVYYDFVIKIMSSPRLETHIAFNVKCKHKTVQPVGFSAEHKGQCRGEA